MVGQPEQARQQSATRVAGIRLLVESGVGATQRGGRGVRREEQLPSERTVDEDGGRDEESECRDAPASWPLGHVAHGNPRAVRSGPAVGRPELAT